jgi:hypothetical protein
VAAAVEAVEAEVRELVRRRGLDPFADQLAMRRLVDEVVHDYDERSLTSSLPPLPDPRSAARAVYDAVAGFGPLQRHLDDPTVEEIWINEPGRVFVAKRGRSELTTTILNDGQVRDLVEKMLKTTGRRVDLSTPFVDAMLPDGSRLHVVIPDLASSVCGGAFGSARRPALTWPYEPGPRWTVLDRRRALTAHRRPRNDLAGGCWALEVSWPSGPGSTAALAGPQRAGRVGWGGAGGGPQVHGRRSLVEQPRGRAGAAGAAGRGVAVAAVPPTPRAGSGPGRSPASRSGALVVVGADLRLGGSDRDPWLLRPPVGRRRLVVGRFFDWLGCSSVRPSTRRTDHRHRRAWILPELGARTLASMPPTDLSWCGR